MTTAMPVLRVSAGGEAFEVAVSRVDLLRYERLEGVSAMEAFGKPTLGMIYKMAYLALLRTGSDLVTTKDMATLTAADLTVGSEALAEAAELEIESGADDPKASDEIPPTG